MVAALALKVSNRVRVRAENQWMGRRYDFQVPVPYESTVGGYSQTSLSAEYNLNQQISIYMRSDNLFNSRYHEFIGFPSPGASIRFGPLFHGFRK